MPDILTIEKTGLSSRSFSPKKILIYSTLSLLLGKAWQHIFWDLPFWIDHFTTFSGIVFSISFTLLFFYKRKTAFLKWMLKISGVILITLSIFLWREKNFQIGQLIEHCSQVISPFLLIFILFRQANFNHLILPIKIAIALTFIGHGLYAFGYHPQPDHYVDMVLNIFPFSESTAKSFLKVAGSLDFLVAILIFVPSTFRFVIWYIFIWALLTSLARIVANLDTDLLLTSLHRWLFEVLVRVPHFGLALALIVNNKNKNPQNNFIDTLRTPNR